jgi:hypothetical protein
MPRLGKNGDTETRPSWVSPLEMCADEVLDDRTSVVFLPTEEKFIQVMVSRVGRSKNILGSSEVSHPSIFFSSLGCVPIPQLHSNVVEYIHGEVYT